MLIWRLTIDCKNKCLFRWADDMSHLWVFQCQFCVVKREENKVIKSEIKVLLTIFSQSKSWSSLFIYAEKFKSFTSYFCCQQLTLQWRFVYIYLKNWNSVWSWLDRQMSKINGNKYESEPFSNGDMHVIYRENSTGHLSNRMGIIHRKDTKIVTKNKSSTKSSETKNR